jgi:hypothetical protein
MNESWVSFSDADVFNGTSQERLAVVNIKRRDDLPDICDQVVEQIRQAYALSNRELGPEGTIPAGLVARAIAIATWRFVSEGLPKIEKLATKERESAFTEASDFIGSLARLELGTATSPSVGRRARRFDHCDEDGI